jgi:hypothetical protein
MGTIWQNVSSITEETTFGELETILLQLPPTTMLNVKREGNGKAFMCSLKTLVEGDEAPIAIETTKLSLNLALALEATLIEHIAKLASVIS